MSSNSNNIKFISLLACGTAVSGWLFYQWRKQQLQMIEDVAQILDDTLIHFILDLRTQCFPHLFLVAGIMKKLRLDCPDDNHYEMTYEKVLPEVQKLFQSKQNLVLVKYGIPLEQMMEAINKSDNVRVGKLIQQYEDLYNSSLGGQEPSIKLSDQTLAKFQKEDIITILNEVLGCSMEIIYNICQTLRKQNGKDYKIILQSQEFLSLLHQREFIKAKQAILINHGVAQYENEFDEIGEVQSPTEIFQKILQLNKSKNETLRVIIDELETRYEKLIGQFLSCNIEESEAQKLISGVTNNIQ